MMGAGVIFFLARWRKAGSTLNEASRTQRLPTVANSPRVKVPWWLETIRLPKPTVVVKPARTTPFAVLRGSRTIP